MKNLFEKDNVMFGILVGLVAPILFFSVLYAVVFLAGIIFSQPPFMRFNSLVLLGIAPNFLLVRRFMSRKKMEHTGGGLVAVTFAYIMLFFLMRSYLLDVRLPGLLY